MKDKDKRKGKPKSNDRKEGKKPYVSPALKAFGPLGLMSDKVWGITGE